MAFLTEAEVAARLRCTLAKVKRLRVTGKLPYLRARPPLVEEADLEAYIASATRRVVPPPPQLKTERPPGGPLTPEEEEEIRLRVRRTWLKHRFRRLK